MVCILADWAGETAVISVAETTLKLMAVMVPNVTLVAPVKPVPVMVTVVPPAVVPEVGATAVTAGAAAASRVEPLWCVDVDGLVDGEQPAMTTASTATSASGLRARRRLDPDGVSPLHGLSVAPRQPPGNLLERDSDTFSTCEPDGASSG